MKKIIFIFSLLLLANNCLAAGSANNGNKTDLYKSAKKLILKAKKLEKKYKIEKALTLYLKAYKKLEKAYAKVNISLNPSSIIAPSCLISFLNINVCLGLILDLELCL